MSSARVLRTAGRWRQGALALLAIASGACANLVDLGPEFTKGDGGGGGGAAPIPDGVTLCAGVYVNWVRRLGDAARQFPLAAVADAQRGVWVSGDFYGQIDVTPPVTSTGLADAFLLHFAADGAYLGGRSFGDEISQKGFVLAALPDGGVVAAGEHSGTIDFGLGAVTAVDDYDAFVARYDASGTALWVKAFGGSGFQGVRAVAVDVAGGSVVVTGPFHEGIDLGGGPLENHGGADVFLAKLDLASGGHVWSRSYGGQGHEYGNAIAIAPNGNIVVAGQTNDYLDLGSGVQASSDHSADAWVAAYGAAGNPAWSHVYPRGLVQNIQFLATDGAGYVVLSGFSDNGMDLGSLQNQDGHGGFIGRLSPAGDALAISLQQNAPSNGIALYPDGSVLMAAWTEGDADLGGTSIGSFGGWDALVAKLDASFTPLWSLHFGSRYDDFTVGPTVGGPYGEAYVVASFYETVQIPDCGSFTSNGDRDMLLMKLAP